MNPFSEIIKEASEKHHVMAFGRMNPPSSGHLQVLDKVRDVAKAKNATHGVVLSGSHDPKKNPLSGAQKQLHLKRYSPETNTSVADKSSPTILHAASKIHSDGAQHLHVVAGSDRQKEMHDLLHKYNGVSGAHGHYNFKSITVHSSGERDPDAEGVSGMSGTKMREHAKNNDFKEFRKGVPAHVSDEHAKELMHHVRAGSGLNETFAQGNYTSDFTVKQWVDPETGETKSRKIHPKKMTVKKDVTNPLQDQLNAIKDAQALKVQPPYVKTGVSEHIEKIGSKYELVSKKTGKNLGKYPTKAGALNRERQVEYFKHIREDKEENEPKDKKSLNKKAKIKFFHGEPESLESQHESNNQSTRKPMKSFTQFQESLLEYETDKNGRYVHKGSYGGSYQDPEGMEDSERKRLKKIADATGEKRGRGRPAGSKSGARKGIGASKLHREEFEQIDENIDEGYDKSSSNHKQARKMAKDWKGKATFHPNGHAHVSFNNHVVGRSTLEPNGTTLWTGSDMASKAAKEYGGKAEGNRVHFNEESEQIDELSKAKLRNYVIANSINLTSLGRKAGVDLANDRNDSHGANEKKIHKHTTGMVKAAWRLAKESVELDEAEQIEESDNTHNNTKQDAMRALGLASKATHHRAYHDWMAKHHDLMTNYHNMHAMPMRDPAEYDTVGAKFHRSARDYHRLEAMR